MWKKNIFLFLFLFVFVFTLTRFFSNNELQEIVKKPMTSLPAPQITSYGIDEPGDYYYVVDERTGVVYISYNSVKRHSMTVALNADGTPVTKEQLLKEKKGD